MPTVSLVGYTNAGKSTLFNALTGEHIYVADQLFATLDPTMRKVELAGAGAVILADTVGFIRDLPHQFVEAFRATLEETAEADLLLQVIDISDPNWREMVFAVQQVLAEIGVTEIPIIQVFNKIDAQENWLPKIDQQEGGAKVWVSS
jgi:GTP-binding protein HflX